ncbi:MAG: zinc ABC transporter substrate-binding protein [Deltaproteobacteria bacterium]|nr:zinc ABC transporter substrate-binding protein [Deltaproteobacteria bacterium]
MKQLIRRSKLSLFVVCLLSVASLATSARAAPLRVVTTMPCYADIAKRVGGNRVTAEALVKGYQDPHFLRPKPSLANKLKNADLLVSTGLDLELWLPSLIDLSRNPEIRSGQRRYVSASQGVTLLEIPTVKSRVNGGVHLFGNPRICTSPINAKVIARNIATGLIKVDPRSEETYRKNLHLFAEEIDRRLYGKRLIEILGARILNRMVTNPDRLVAFLEEKQYKGKPLIEYLGGWLKKGLPLRGRKIVGYHKNWAYFNHLFGLKMVNYLEPRPAIPPTPKHIEQVIEQMRQEKISVVVAANYFPEDRVRLVAERVGATAVIVSMDVGGMPKVTNYFEYIDHLLDALLNVFANQG